MKAILIPLSLLFAFSCMISCKKEDAPPPTPLPYVAPRIIKGVVPTSGVPGDKVRIYGGTFNYTPGENEVTFNGVPAVVDSSHSDLFNGELVQMLKVTIPPGATTGPLKVKAYYATDSLPTFTIEKQGSLLVYCTNVDEPSTVTLNDDPFIGRVVTTSSTNYCADPTLQAYKARITVGKKYKLFADNALAQWTIPDISISAENECKAINLSAANISGTSQDAVVFFNYECGFYYINVWLDGKKIGQMQDEGQGAFPSRAAVADITAGKHTYQAISHNGHTWTGSFTTQPGKTTRIDLSKASADPVPSGYCNIIIYRSSYTVPIDVFVTNYDNPTDDYVGQIRGGYSSASCTLPLAVSVIRKVGGYNFRAGGISTGGGYWNGNVKANVSGGCVVVKLN